jgi:hypothetical protein
MIPERTASVNNGGCPIGLLGCPVDDSDWSLPPPSPEKLAWQGICRASRLLRDASGWPRHEVIRPAAMDLPELVRFCSAIMNPDYTEAADAILAAWVLRVVRSDARFARSLCRALDAAEGTEDRAP